MHKEGAEHIIKLLNGGGTKNCEIPSTINVIVLNSKLPMVLLHFFKHSLFHFFFFYISVSNIFTTRILKLSAVNLYPLLFYEMILMNSSNKWIFLQVF